MFLLDLSLDADSFQTGEYSAMERKEVSNEHL
jgi:hypothetical protein